MSKLQISISTNVIDEASKKIEKIAKEIDKLQNRQIKLQEQVVKRSRKESELYNNRLNEAKKETLSFIEGQRRQTSEQKRADFQKIESARRKTSDKLTQDKKEQLSDKRITETILNNQKRKTATKLSQLKINEENVRASNKKALEQEKSSLRSSEENVRSSNRKSEDILKTKNKIADNITRTHLKAQEDTTRTHNKIMFEQQKGAVKAGVKIVEEGVRLKSKIILQERAFERRDENDRIKRQEQLKRREDYDRRRILQEKVSLSRAGMFYVTAPTLLATSLALRNTMKMETDRIRTNLMYGEDADKVFGSLMQYAMTSSFSGEQALLLANIFKPSQKNLGIKNNEDLVRLVKRVGDAIIPMVDPEDFYEVTRQLGQIASKGYAESRMDIDVLQGRKFMIRQMLAETGSDYEALKEKYGARIPAQVLFKAIVDYSQLEKVLKAKAERAKTLAESWQNFSETLAVASGVTGKSISNAAALPSLLKDASELLRKLSFDDQGKLKDGFEKPIGAIIGATTIAIGLGIPLAFFYFNWVRLGRLLTAGGTMGMFGKAISKITAATIIMSSAYKIVKSEEGISWKTIQDNAVELGLAIAVFVANYKKLRLGLLFLLRNSYIAIAAIAGIEAYKALAPLILEPLKGMPSLTDIAGHLISKKESEGDKIINDQSLKEAKKEVNLTNNVHIYGEGNPNMEPVIYKTKSKVTDREPYTTIVGDSGKTQYWRK